MRLMLAVYVALCVPLVFGCGEEADDFTAPEAQRMAEAQGYVVTKCYPERGGNFDCLVDGNIWLHVREGGSMNLTEDPRDD